MIRPRHRPFSNTNNSIRQLHSHPYLLRMTTRGSMTISHTQLSVYHTEPSQTFIAPHGAHYSHFLHVTTSAHPHISSTLHNSNQGNMIAHRRFFCPHCKSHIIILPSHNLGTQHDLRFLRRRVGRHISDTAKIDPRETLSYMREATSFTMQRTPHSILCMWNVYGCVVSTKYIYIKHLIWISHQATRYIPHNTNRIICSVSGGV